MPSADLLDRADLPHSADRPAGRGARHRRRAGRLGGVPAVATVGIGLAALGFWVVAVRDADFAAMSDAGLSSVLGWPYAVALAAAVGAFVAELASRQRAVILTGLTVVLVVILFGTASAVEPIARLPDSWITAGFVQYISVHGQILRFTDARFYWPGMFSMTALVDAAMGRSSATDLIGWAPLGFELLYLPALLSIRRAAGVGSRAGWLGIAIFYVGNWVEQDYFSPQALNLLILLVVVGVALNGWKPSPTAVPGGPDLLGRRAGSWRSWLRRRVPPLPWGKRMLGVPVYGPGTTCALALLLVVLSAASVASHQLTPVAIVLALVALALSRRLPNFQLLLLVPVLILAWVAFAATDFWEYGHTALILGGLGHLGTSLSSGVSQRVTGTTIHRAVTDLRILISAAVFGLAVAGSLLRRTRCRDLELLAIAPFAILGMQSYGGEATLRSYLYALPFAALLAGEAGAFVAGWSVSRWNRRTRLLRHPRAVRWLRVTSVATLLLVGAGLLTFVRGGNDAYVAATPTDRLAVTTVYRAAKPGQVIGDLEPYVPWMDQGMGEWHFVTLVPIVRDGTVRGVQMTGIQPNWIILTSTEERYGEIVNGWPVGWQAQAERLLVRRDHYRVYRSLSGAAVLRGTPGPIRLTPAQRRALRQLERTGVVSTKTARLGARTGRVP